MVSMLPEADFEFAIKNASSRRGAKIKKFAGVGMEAESVRHDAAWKV